jgi:hypothetical protein
VVSLVTFSSAVEIPLSRGQVALVDAADAPALCRHKWCAMPAQRGTFYAVRSVEGTGRRVPISASSPRRTLA